jgi:hypothetical protein
LGHNAGHLFRALQSNRQNLLQRIEQLQSELAEWRQLLMAEPDGEGKHPLLAALEAVVKEREAWEAQTMLKNWEEPPASTQPVAAEGAGLFRQMFFGNLMNRRAPRPEKRG